MYWNLKDEMRRAHITTRKLAAMVGISESSMSKKLNGHYDFLLEEARKIRKIFPRCESDYLFEQGPDDRMDWE